MGKNIRICIKSQLINDNPIVTYDNYDLYLITVYDLDGLKSIINVYVIKTF